MNTEQKVLIIDSDLENCKAIKYALAEYGFGAYYILTVVDGIECLMQHNYELWTFFSEVSRVKVYTVI